MAQTQSGKPQTGTDETQNATPPVAGNGDTPDFQKLYDAANAENMELRERLDATDKKLAVAKEALEVANDDARNQKLIDLATKAADAEAKIAKLEAEVADSKGGSKPVELAVKEIDDITDRLSKRGDKVRMTRTILLRNHSGWSNSQAVDYMDGLRKDLADKASETTNVFPHLPDFDAKTSKIVLSVTFEG